MLIIFKCNISSTLSYLSTIYISNILYYYSSTISEVWHGVYKGNLIMVVTSHIFVYYSKFKIQELRVVLQYSAPQTTNIMNKISALRIFEEIIIISTSEDQLSCYNFKYKIYTIKIIVTFRFKTIFKFILRVSDQLELTQD